MISASLMKDELFAAAIPGKRDSLSKFFKTNKGDYAEGDLFIGVPVPLLRKFVKQYGTMPPSDIEILLSDEFHECRMIALLFLVDHYKKSVSNEEKINIFNFYVNHTRGINNWDLVDVSAPTIIGDFLLNRNRSILYELIDSNIMWEQRMAMVATWTFIRHNDFTDTFKFAEKLENTPHDLLQKATGWMLREIGKKDEQQLINYLNIHHTSMPRTTLRYAIERLNEQQKKNYIR